MIPSAYHCPLCGASRPPAVLLYDPAGERLPSWPKACVTCLRDVSLRPAGLATELTDLARTNILRCAARTHEALGIAADFAAHAAPDLADLLGELIPEHVEEPSAGIWISAVTSRAQDDASALLRGVEALHAVAVAAGQLARTWSEARQEGLRTAFSPHRGTAARDHAHLAIAVLGALS